MPLQFIARDVYSFGAYGTKGSDIVVYTGIKLNVVNVKGSYSIGNKAINKLITHFIDTVRIVNCELNK